MKKYIVSILVLFVCPITFADANLDLYKNSLAGMTIEDLTKEVSLRFLNVGWSCGTEIANKLYNDVYKNGKNVSDLNLGTDPKCKNVSTLLTLSVSEVKKRNHSYAVEKGYVEDTATYFHFNLNLPSSITDEAKESGDESCLVNARKMYSKWRANVSWPPLSDVYSKDYDTKKDVCWIEVHADRHYESCSFWNMEAGYDFKTGIFNQMSGSIQIFSDKEKEILKKQAFAEEIEFGTHFLYNLQFQPGSKSAELTLQGIDGKTWRDGLYTQHIKPYALPAKCAIKTHLPISSDVITAGKPVLSFF